MFRDGFLTEASASNVLIVKDGTIIVPPKDNQILPGITYDATMEFARDAGVPLVRAAGAEGRGAGGRRDVAVVVDEGSARDHDRRWPAVRRRHAGPGVPQAVGGVPGAEAARATLTARASASHFVSFAAAARCVPKRP